MIAVRCSGRQVQCRLTNSLVGNPDMAPETQTMAVRAVHRLGPAPRYHEGCKALAVRARAAGR
jgi:hypothetical protein